MRDTRYKRRGRYGADMTYYALLMAEDNRGQLDQLRRNLADALREDVTQRQRQELSLYYVQGMSMREIARYLDIDRTTVSRTLKRGEQRLRRCLRYGGAALLNRSVPEKPPRATPHNGAKSRRHPL